MKIVVNRCYGGFSVTRAVYDELGFEWNGWGGEIQDLLDPRPFYERMAADDRSAWRADPRLIAAIEKVGVKAASGTYAELEIVEIPDDVDWEIGEYDGLEWVAEKHRRW